jgi:hypothetical protein
VLLTWYNIWQRDSAPAQTLIAEKETRVTAFDPATAAPDVHQELDALISSIVSRTDHAAVNAAEREFKRRLLDLGCDDTYINGAINYAWLRGKTPPRP